MTPVERYSVHYRISAPALDVDALAAAARPTRPYELWHRGDVVHDGQRARTSGLQIDIVDGGDAGEVIAALENFLDAESAFLARARQAAADETQQVIACALWVYAEEPVDLDLPHELLSRLVEARLSLEISAYPRE